MFVGHYFYRVFITVILFDPYNHPMKPVLLYFLFCEAVFPIFKFVLHKRASNDF